MHKTLLVFKQEFMKTIRRRGFIILTLAVPVIALLGIVIYQAISGVTRPPAEATKIGYVDQSGGFDQSTDQGGVALLPFASNDKAKAALVDQQIKEYFVIPADYLSSGAINMYLTQKELAPSDAVTAAISRFLTANLLAGKVAPEVIARISSPPQIIATTLTASGEIAPQQSSYLNFIVPSIFSFLMGLSLIFSATYVLQSLAEEKENRLMEILISSISPRQLLAGKVLGLGAAGMVQVLVWVISLPLLLRLATSSIGGLLANIQVPANFWVLGVIYFILGYGFFAVLSAAIAALSSSVQEAQGIAGIYGMFNVAPFWLLSLILIYPNSPAWVILSIFPLSAPVMTMIRLGLIGVPAWQLALSMIVMVLAVVGGLYVAARLLRAYMLMYGKRPNLGEIVRNFRNA
jgi:ABC-2 type transport system permease protein